MCIRSPIVTLAMAALFAGSLAATADAFPRKRQGNSQQFQTQTGAPQAGNLAAPGNGATKGSMDGWPQNLDELENAYNCGPYADKESSKKCKE